MGETMGEKMGGRTGEEWSYIRDPWLWGDNLSGRAKAARGHVSPRVGKRRDSGGADL
jgi:hypothetical protein